MSLNMTGLFPLLGGCGTKSMGDTVYLVGTIFFLPMLVRFSVKIWHTQILLTTFMGKQKVDLFQMITAVMGVSPMTGLSRQWAVSWLRRYTRPIPANGF